MRRERSDGGAVKSPCINVCRMEAGLCAGCLRTIEEIARWGNIGDDEKRLILLAVARRRDRPEAADAGHRG